ncbi:MAG: DUF4760 domain-containing protein [Leptospiraceae bacterium]|nr:DUF4760 domain-containing protein [Leptospiraceae bacterium]MCP5494742.1 DUF4760 domain-containing protein [Leptospiraceae bacterium]
MWQWISTILSFLSLISLILIVKQIRDTRVWNKIHFTYTFFPDALAFESIEVFLDKRISFWKRDSPLTETEVKALLGKSELRDDELHLLGKAFDSTIKKDGIDDIKNELSEAGRKLKLYMNQIESYCAAISSGVIISETAKNIYSYKFKRAYEKAKPWIDELRRRTNEQGLYIELQKTIKEWYPEIKGEVAHY